MKKKKRSNYKRSRDKFNRNIPEKYYTKDDFFYSRIASILMIPRGKVRSIFSERAITIIRLNSLKGNSEETKEALMKKGYEPLLASFSSLSMYSSISQDLPDPGLPVIITRFES